MAQPARKYDLANTNIAMLGTPLEKAVKKQASKGEPAWRDAGTKLGIKIWRIEKFKVKVWPPNEYGQFYSGDSYILLHTYLTRGGTGYRAFDIHFWIGQGSSQDEYGTAAYKTVELDDFLGGKATQYREVMGRESRRFKMLFPQLTILEGGVASGFNPVKPKKYKPRLLHIKGRSEHLLVREVPLSYKSLNSGDSFIWDGGLRILAWHGRETSPQEKAKSAQVVQALDDRANGRATREVFDEGLDDDDEFWSKLDKRGPVTPKSDVVADEDIARGVKCLLKVSDAEGTITMTELAVDDNISYAMLTPNDVFILDDGFEVFVWIGKEASIEERRVALNKAVHYLNEKGRPLDTPISRILEGGENELFTAAFKDAPIAPNNPYTKGLGVVPDVDELYRKHAADPNNWEGRVAPGSGYARQLQAAKKGAYSPQSNFPSSWSKERRLSTAEQIEETQRQLVAEQEAEASKFKKDYSREPQRAVQLKSMKMTSVTKAAPAQAAAPAEPAKPEPVAAPTEAPKAEPATAPAPAEPAPPAAVEAAKPAPVAEAPKTDPVVEVAATETPKAEAEAPKPETPKAEAPKAEAPKVEAPKVDAPKAVEENSAEFEEKGLTPAYHGLIDKAKAEELLKGYPDGTYLFRSRAKGNLKEYVLSVNFRGKPTHHLCSRAGLGEELKVNKKPTNSTTFEGVAEYLATKKKGWWPVELKHQCKRE